MFTAGGLGLPPVYPIMREHLRRGNHVTLISGFRSADLMFWTGPDERVGRLQAEFGDQLEVIYTTNDGSTTPRATARDRRRRGPRRRRVARDQRSRARRSDSPAASAPEGAHTAQ